MRDGRAKIKTPMAALGDKEIEANSEQKKSCFAP